MRILWTNSTLVSKVKTSVHTISVLGNNSSSTEANNDLSIDPFSPMAQKELTDFDLLRNEIEGGAGNGTNIKSSNGNGGTTSPNPFDLGDMGKAKVFFVANQGYTYTNKLTYIRSLIFDLI